MSEQDRVFGVTASGGGDHRFPAQKGLSGNPERTRLDRAPVRGMMLDVDDPSIEMEFPFNPSQFTIAWAAQYAILNPRGSSRPIQQFSHTNPLRLTFDLLLDSTILRSGNRSNNDFFDPTQRLAFLQHFLVPMDEIVAGEQMSTRAPMAAFVFGERIVIRGFVHSVIARIRKFSSSAQDALAPTGLVAAVTMLEQLPRNISSREVLGRGLFRAFESADTGAGSSGVATDSFTERGG